MKVLDKDEPNTWWGGGRLAPSNPRLRGRPRPHPIREVRGLGGVSLGLANVAEPDEQLQWGQEMSDHGQLFFEVQRPPQ
jgi:hypothetical protein